MMIHTSQTYGIMPDGRDVKLHTLRNQHGLIAKVTEYGATLVSMETPDRMGNIADITLGFDSFDGWLTNIPCFGATIGRFANRIDQGKFTLDEQEYHLSINNNTSGTPSHLHGGNIGFDKVLWTTTNISKNSVSLSYLSKNGEEGYPGNLTITVTYTLNDENELIWEAEATTDSLTIINLTNHTYWNLSANPNTTIHDHILSLKASHYLPTTSGLIPTGEITSVSGTPLDFTFPTTIGDRIHEDFPALKNANGFDSCLVIDSPCTLRTAAIVSCPSSGRSMEILTNQPGIQFYSANFLDGTIAGKNSTRYQSQSALCLETQNFPDAPNHPNFPSATLHPNQTYHHITIHRFSNKK